MQQLLTDDLWLKVRKLTQRARRVHAAVSYVTTLKYLSLKRGDTLIVDASHRAIQSGETSAKVLWRLRHNVRLFSLPGLHAKIVLADDRVVVGSANASESSAVKLFESAVLTDCPTTVSQTKAFLFRLEQLAIPLDFQRLQELSAIKVVRRHNLSFGRRVKEAPKRSIWVVSSQDLADGQYADEESLVSAAEREIRRELPEADPSWIRWHGNARIRTKARKWDKFIVTSSQKGKRIPYEVMPPLSLLKVQRHKNWTRFYYDPKLEPARKTVTWKQFAVLFKRVAGGLQIKPMSTRALPPKIAERLFAEWPQVKRR